MNVLITGVNGFIGGAIAKRLVEKKHTVTGVVRDKSQIGNDSINYITHDFSDPFDVSKFPQDIDYILHFAATMDRTISVQQMFRINTASTLDLLDYGKTIGIKKFIFASSGGVYGYSSHILSETSVTTPGDFYGQTKIQSEQLVDFYNKSFTTVNLRLFFPYGAGQKTGIIPRLTDMVKSGHGITIYNNGGPNINPIHISDVISAVEAAMNLKGKHTLNVCGDETISIHNLAALISNRLEITPRFKADDKEIKNLIGSNSRMKAYLRTKPKICLYQGILEYLNDLKSREKL